jgi:hypothetical protein
MLLCIIMTAVTPTCDFAMFVWCLAYSLARCTNVASSGEGCRVLLSLLLWSVKPSKG